MDHIVLFEPDGKSMENLLAGKKTFLLRGAMGKKIPYGKIKKGESLYFAHAGGAPQIQAQGYASRVVETDKLGREQSIALISGFEDKLLLSKTQEKKYAGKRYLVLVEVSEVEPVDAFMVNPAKVEGTEDWLVARNIDRAKI